MTRLGYEPHVVGVTADALAFSKEQIREFQRLNEEGIKKMNADLAVENPDDLNRRLKQKAVLEQKPVLLTVCGESDHGDSDGDESEGDDRIKGMYAYRWPKRAGKAGYLRTEDIVSRFEIEEEKRISAGDFTINYYVAMQRGYYPSDQDKPCQDSYLTGSFGSVYWLCVFDGHGPTGDKCAQYARDEVTTHCIEPCFSRDALGTALLRVNEELHASDIDDSNSGTTALVVLIEKHRLLIGNVGDCRCVVVSKRKDGKLSVHALTKDQTPHRKDELIRIKKAGGLVMTSEQYDHDEPMHENWVDGDSPPRIWSKEGKFPGCAFTRSIGDANGEALGVIAEAEFTEYALGDADQMLMVGSDGIFEFVSDAEVSNIASHYDTPSEVCRALVGESYKRWIKKG